MTAQRLALVPSAMALAFVLGACDKMPLVAPSGTVITLIAATNALPSNGSTDITAVLIENGTTSTGTGTGNQTTPTAGAGTPVHNGTLVTFTTSLGRIEPAEARTTAGRATVKLIADGRSGVATITAISGGANRTLTVNVGAAAAARILVTANPQALPATGGVSVISARVEEAQGNPLQAVPVSFSTTAGSLSSGTALTDGSGIASVNLTTTAAATVTASAGGGATATTLSGTVAITVNPNLALSFTPQTGDVTVSAPMTFTLSVGTTPVITGVRVNFGDGESFDVGPITGTQTIPHMYGSFGTFTASATATAADGTTKTVSSPVVVRLYTVTLTSSGNAAVGATSTFTATVTPASVSVAEYVFDFGDGSVERTASPQITHTFHSPGTKTVRVTVIPTKGPSLSAIAQLVIS